MGALAKDDACEINGETKTVVDPASHTADLVPETTASTEGISSSGKGSSASEAAPDEVPTETTDPVSNKKEKTPQQIARDEFVSQFTKESMFQDKMLRMLGNSKRTRNQAVREHESKSQNPAGSSTAMARESPRASVEIVADVPPAQPLSSSSVIHAPQNTSEGVTHNSPDMHESDNRGVTPNGDSHLEAGASTVSGDASSNQDGALPAPELTSSLSPPEAVVEKQPIAAQLATATAT